MTNVVVVQGRLSRPVDERTLASGDRLATLDLTVPADPEGAGSARSESVPLAWFGPPQWVLALDVGAELVVLGRVRRRFFRAGERLESRTEVVVEAAAPIRRAARVAELVERARMVVQDVGAPSRANLTDEARGIERRTRRKAPATFP